MEPKEIPAKVRICTRIPARDEYARSAPGRFDPRSDGPFSLTSRPARPRVAEVCGEHEHDVEHQQVGHDHPEPPLAEFAPGRAHRSAQSYRRKIRDNEAPAPTTAASARAIMFVWTHVRQAQ